MTKQMEVIRNLARRAPSPLLEPVMATPASAKVEFSEAEQQAYIESVEMQSKLKQLTERISKDRSLPLHYALQVALNL